MRIFSCVDYGWVFQTREELSTNVNLQFDVKYVTKLDF
jgi:hypothetical protein